MSDDEIVKEIKQRAWLDAVEYQMQHGTVNKAIRFIARYEDLILQRYYESQFICYLNEILDNQFKADNTNKEI